MSKKPLASAVDVYTFAVKWKKKFQSRDTTREELTDEHLGQECQALGFEMDGGQAFFQAYGMAFDDWKDLQQILGDVTYIPLLGSAIYSQWRYFNHWAGPGDNVLSKENRAWFTLALSRLADLAAAAPTRTIPQGTGRILKLRIVSALEDGCELLRMPGEEVEQHLSVTEDGRVFFSSYLRGKTPGECERGETRQFQAVPVLMERLMEACEQYFFRDFAPSFAEEEGRWTAQVTDEQGKTYSYTGYLGQEILVNGENLSDLFRTVLDMPNLFVFDGQAQPDQDPIQRISVEYSRPARTPAGGPGSGDAADLEYSESLILDREDETILHTRQFGSRCSASKTYQLKGLVSSFLDGLDEHRLFQKPAPRVTGTTWDPYTQGKYKILMKYEKRPQMKRSGTLVNDALPEELAEFMRQTMNFLTSLGMGEEFTPGLYGMESRCEGRPILCCVIFRESDRETCCQTEDDSLSVGDLVRVSAGMRGQEQIGRIVRKAYCLSQRLPDPLDGLKRILGPYVPKDKD